MSLRDLDINVEITGFDDELSTANDQIDDLRENSETAGDALDELGDSGSIAGENISEGMETATGATQSLMESLQNVDIQLAAVGAAAGAFTLKAAQAASLYQKNVGLLRVRVGSDFPDVMKALNDEVERTGRLFTTGQLAQLAAPLFGMLPGNAKIVTDNLHLIDDAVIAMGADERAAQMSWIALMTAIGSGTATTLLKPSRIMPFALIQGDEAVALTKQMSAEQTPLNNAIILFKALSKSTALSQEQLEYVMHLTELEMVRLKNTFGDFMEQAGAPYVQLQGEMADSTATFLDRVIKGHWGEAIGRFAGLATVLLGIPSAISLIIKGVGWLGATFGLTAAAAMPWIGVLLGAALVLEDFWAYMQGAPSLIFGFMPTDQEIIQGFTGIYDLYKKYVNDPLWKLESTFQDHFLAFWTVTLPNAVRQFGHMIEQFFSVTVINALAKLGNDIMDIPVLGWIIKKLGGHEIGMREYSSPPEPSQYAPGTANTHTETITNPETGQIETMWRNLPNEAPSVSMEEQRILEVPVLAGGVEGNPFPDSQWRAADHTIGSEGWVSVGSELERYLLEKWGYAGIKYDEGAEAPIKEVELTQPKTEEVPGMAVGGSVEEGGALLVHKGEDITSAADVSYQKNEILPAIMNAVLTMIESQSKAAIADESLGVKMQDFISELDSSFSNGLNVEFDQDKISASLGESLNVDVDLHDVGQSVADALSSKGIPVTVEDTDTLIGGVEQLLSGGDLGDVVKGVLDKVDLSEIINSFFEGTDVGSILSGMFAKTSLSDAVDLPDMMSSLLGDSDLGKAAASALSTALRGGDLGSVISELFSNVDIDADLSSMVNSLLGDTDIGEAVSSLLGGGTDISGDLSTLINVGQAVLSKGLSLGDAGSVATNAGFDPLAFAAKLAINDVVGTIKDAGVMQEKVAAAEVGGYVDTPEFRAEMNQEGLASVWNNSPLGQVVNGLGNLFSGGKEGGSGDLLSGTGEVLDSLLGGGADIADTISSTLGGGLDSLLSGDIGAGSIADLVTNTLGIGSDSLLGNVAAGAADFFTGNIPGAIINGVQAAGNLIGTMLGGEANEQGSSNQSTTEVPEGAGFQLPMGLGGLTLEIHEGAIVVNGSNDPETTAEEILERLKGEALTELEMQLGGGIARAAR